jgi:hypothetical protein
MCLLDLIFVNWYLSCFVLWERVYERDNKANSILAKGDGMETVVVSGDLTIDWLEVPVPPINSSGTGAGPVQNWRSYAGTRQFARPGGALLLAQLVRAATRQAKSGCKVVCPELTDIVNISPDTTIHSLASLDLFPKTTKKDEKAKVCRVKEMKGFSGPVEGLPTFPAVQNDDPEAKLVVLDDPGNGFRDVPTAWPVALKDGKPLIIYKMHRPLAEGKLWEKLQQDHADRLVVVISADDLRWTGAQISRRLSWERTATDFVWQMAGNPKLLSLNNFGYLVVRFGVDGAILYRRREGVVETRLFYDPQVGEDGFGDLYPGQMLGITSAFVAALTADILQHGLNNLGEGIRNAILAARYLHREGFGGTLTNPDFPGEEVFHFTPEERLSVAEIPVPLPSGMEHESTSSWCILNDLARNNLEESAYRYVMHGKDPVLNRVPMGQFGKLVTMDRSEIESYRSIRNLIREYLDRPKVKYPLCIGVFGPPGSGKSFGIMQVALGVIREEMEKLEFNLSQFVSTEDLVTALHKVHDVVLGGKIPLVFFDEFDSDFHGKLGWLKYLLMPMQDGQFRDKETLHPIGRSIFIFAGGTSATQAEFSGDRKETPFGPSEDSNEKLRKEQAETEARKFKDAKGPDFVSRLRGYVNIKGPNPNPADEDRMYVIRRALILRPLLEEKAKHLFDSRGELHIDPGVLRALIRVSNYKHGTRSMAAIIEMSLLAGRKRFEQAALPSPEQLELHVNAKLFFQLLARDVLLGSARETIAKAIHEKFRADHKERDPNDPSIQPWENLREDFKESNRQQADDIPAKLKAIGCDFRSVEGRNPELITFTPAEAEDMAKLEHDRWNTERFRQGWTYGPEKPGNKEKKISPWLVEWEKLPEKIKDYDHDAVKAIPGLLAGLGFEIYRLK